MIKAGFGNKVKKSTFFWKKLITASLKGISLITLAVFILISGSGIKISMHFCQQQVYDIGILSHAENCSLDVTHQHNSCCEEKNENHSCEDEDIAFNKVDNYLITLVDYNYHTYLNSFFEVYKNHPFNELIVTNSTIKNKFSGDRSPPDIGTFLSKLQVYRL